jgi:hypothetical protein
MKTTDCADGTDIQRLGASMALTRWVRVFPLIVRSNLFNPRNLCDPWSIPSPFPILNNQTHRIDMAQDDSWRDGNLSTASTKEGKRGSQPNARSFALLTRLFVHPRLRLRSIGPLGGSGRSKRWASHA